MAASSQEFLPLSPAEFHILLVLAGEDMHGYAIMQAVKTLSDGAVKLGPGTLYTAIKRMLERGWIIEIESKSDEDERRRYYQLTEMGKRVAKAEAERQARSVQTAKQLGLLGS